MLDLERLDIASQRAANWLARIAQIGEPTDPNRGAIRTEYFFHEKTFVLRPYVWHSAEAIRALSMLSCRIGNSEWRQSAQAAADYLGRIQCKDGTHKGSFFRPWLNGTEPLYVDMNYQSLGGLVELHRTTGDPGCLRIAKDAADWFVDAACRTDGTHLGEYYPDRGVLGGFRSHMLDEGGFLMLHKFTGKKIYRVVFQRQVDALVNSADGEGMFSCRTDPEMQFWPHLRMQNIASRAQYWHVAPLLAAYLEWPRSTYREVLETVALLMMRWQSSRGFLWNVYQPNGRPTERERPDGAATSMFANVWLHLHDITGEQRYLEASERALNWVLESQYKNASDKDTFGAFFQERASHGGRWYDYLRDISSSFGIIACEEYIKRFGP